MSLPESPPNLRLSPHTWIPLVKGHTRAGRKGNWEWIILQDCNAIMRPQVREDWRIHHFSSLSNFNISLFPILHQSLLTHSLFFFILLVFHSQYFFLLLPFPSLFCCFFLSKSLRETPPLFKPNLLSFFGCFLLLMFCFASCCCSLEKPFIWWSWGLQQKFFFFWPLFSKVWQVSVCFSLLVAHVSPKAAFCSGFREFSNSEFLK